MSHRWDREKRAIAVDLQFAVLHVIKTTLNIFPLDMDGTLNLWMMVLSLPPGRSGTPFSMRNSMGILAPNLLGAWTGHRQDWGPLVWPLVFQLLSGDSPDVFISKRMPSIKWELIFWFCSSAPFLHAPPLYWNCKLHIECISMSQKSHSIHWKCCPTYSQCSVTDLLLL